MRIVHSRILQNYPDRRYLYAVQFNNDDDRNLDYFAAFASIIGKLRNAKFDSTTGEWLITQNGYEVFEKLDDELFSEVPKQTIKLNVSEKAVTDYDKIGGLKFPLYEYQQQLVKFSLEAKNTLIVAPCGAGKTPVGISAYVEAIKSGEIKGCGLFVVKASLKTQWFMEVKKFTDLTPKIIQTHASFKGANAEEKFQSQFENADLLILNYETLRDKYVRKALYKVNPQYIFADECQYVKNYNSQRAQALYEFNDAKIKIGATATPVQKDPRDIFGIFHFINPDLFPSLSEFDANFIVFAGRGIIIGTKNLELLNRKISPFMIVKKKEEVEKQLPKLVVVQRYCELEPKQLEMTATIITEIEQLKSKKKKLEENFRTDNKEYRQIDTGILARQNFAQELANSEDLLVMSESELAKKYLTNSKKNHKLDMLMDLIEEIVDSGEKITVFSRFAKMQEVIVNKIQSLAKTNSLFNFKIARVHGTMNEKNRYDEVYTKFQEDDSYKVLLMSDAGAEGFNLSKCKYMCEYEPAQSYAIQTQRHGRIERADSIFDNVMVFQFIANGSWDEVAQKIVSKKQSYDQTIVKGEY